MANKLQYLSQITTGQTIQASHISQLINALSGSEAYDLTVSGSLTVIGTLTATASLATNALSANTATTATTASHAITARSSSFATTASFAQNALTASFIQTAQTASYVATTPSVTGNTYLSGSVSGLVSAFKFIAGAGKTGNLTPEYAVNITEISGKTLGTNCFVTATPSGSGASVVTVKSLVATTLTFESGPDTSFHYHIMYY